MSSIKLQVNTESQKYPIYIGNNVLNKLQKLLNENLINFNQCLVVLDRNVPKKIIIKPLSSVPQKKVVEADEKEINIRKILNFGHTFAHAYEATLGYSKKLNHGEAVILGIRTATKFSLVNKILNFTDFMLIENHLKKLNLPREINKFFQKKDISKILSFMKKDKKNDTKKINLILLKKIGSPIHKLQFDENRINLFLKKELSK